MIVHRNSFLLYLLGFSFELCNIFQDEFYVAFTSDVVIIIGDGAINIEDFVLPAAVSSSMFFSV